MMSIKKNILASLLTFLCVVMPTQAYAEHYEGKTGWQIKYTQSGELVDNFEGNTIDDEIKQLQPGDDITINVTIKQENTNPTDWYIANEILKSLEEAEAEGSGYGYELLYIKDTKTTELYKSHNLGGTGSNGLTDATKSMQNFIYLDELTQNQTGTVRINVSLDGETEQNAYFDKFARIKLRFAVEPQKSTTNNNNTKSQKQQTITSQLHEMLPNTGQNMLIFYIILILVGAGLMGFGVYSWRRGDTDEKHKY